MNKYTSSDGEILETTDQSWADPDPISNDLLPVKSFPLKVVPEPFKDWISDTSYRMQCPPDYIAVASMVEASSLIGTRCGIKPKEHDDGWIITPNLWGGIVGRPSMLKTPALAEALKPLDRLEEKAREKFADDGKSYRVDLLEYEVQQDNLKSELKKAISGKSKRSTEEIKIELLHLEKPETQPMKRYRSNDATIEKLSELLNENPTGLLLFRDELVGLLASWEKQGHESDRAFFLEAWNGNNSFITDRIGRGTIDTKHLCLSLLGGIQPAKLTTLLYQMEGLQNDGLIQRLQLLVYPDEPTNWCLVDKAPNKVARDCACSAIERLSSFDFKNVNTVSAVSKGSDKKVYLNFAPDAQQVFNDWLTKLEGKLRRIDNAPIIQEHLGKHRSLMPSLALIIHLIECMDSNKITSVTKQAALRAVEWCDYLESHARRCYGMVLGISLQAADSLTKKLKHGKLSDGFTARDVQRKNWQFLTTIDLVTSACNELTEANWLRKIITPPAFQHKGKTSYLINPKISKETLPIQSEKLS